MTALRHLVDELSWEGNARKYRDGGRGIENVLTAEVFGMIDVLPRDPFLLMVLAGADIALNGDVEGLEIDVLPGDVVATDWEIAVQPDVLISSPTDYVLVEAKGTKKGVSFQPEQLYREMVIADQQRDGRSATLLVVTADPPPVRVRGHGRHDLAAAIELGYRLAGEKRSDVPVPDALQVEVRHVTWREIGDVVSAAAAGYRGSTTSVDRAVCRAADAIVEAITWHSGD